MSIAPNLLATKARIVFLNQRGQIPSSVDLNIDASPNTRLMGWPLLRAHEWMNRDASKVIAVFIDLDEISATRPLDKWAIKAWRATFNDFIGKCVNANSQAPELVGYTAQSNWDSAVLGVQIGIRDIVKLSRIKDHLAGYTGKEIQKNEGDNIVPFKKTPPQNQILPKGNIPHHAIPFPIEGLEGSSTAIESVRNLIRKSAPIDTPILITGHTGTGKELVAKSIHQHSHRANAPMITVNCGAIAPNLFESELFGHVRGAFSGADKERIGLLEAANGGTLFFDEISSLPKEFQVKLLRVLQSKQITPVGSNDVRDIDIRIVTASKENLGFLVEQGLFREDLLYRLRVIEIQLPSLRERRADIPELCQSILKKFCRKNKKPVPELNTEALERILLYSWPGNIRELENALEHGATLALSENRKRIFSSDLPDFIVPTREGAAHEMTLKEAVSRYEKEYIIRTITRLGGSKEEAADALGLSLATLYRKIGKLG